MGFVGQPCQDQAHPRVSGENDQVTDEVNDLLGSSPRERGKLARATVRFFRTGLIPA